MDTVNGASCVAAILFHILVTLLSDEL